MCTSNIRTDSSALRYSRKQALPLKSAQTGYPSDIMYGYVDESDPGVVFKFGFLWPCKKDAWQLSPISNASSSSEQDHESGSSSNSSKPSSALSCNISSFPCLLGEIIDRERQKRSQSSSDLFALEQDIKQASGAIILASKKLHCIIKDSDENKKSVNSSNNELAYKKLKSPLVCHVSLGVSSAYPDTDLEFWRSNLQKQLRLRHRNSYIFKRTNKQVTATVPPRLRSRTNTSKVYLRNRNLQRTSVTPLNSASNPEQTSTPERRCVSCGSSNTPCWRPSWYGNTGLLCNCCGLRYKKIGVRCLNKNCRHIPLRSEFREMKSRMNGSSTIDCIKCGGEVKIRG